MDPASVYPVDSTREDSIRDIDDCSAISSHSSESRSNSPANDRVASPYVVDILGGDFEERSAPHAEEEDLSAAVHTITETEQASSLEELASDIIVDDRRDERLSEEDEQKQMADLDENHIGEELHEGETHIEKELDEDRGGSYGMEEMIIEDNDTNINEDIKQDTNMDVTNDTETEESVSSWCSNASLIKEIVRLNAVKFV